MSQRRSEILDGRTANSFRVRRGDNLETGTVLGAAKVGVHSIYYNRLGTTTYQDITESALSGSLDTFDATNLIVTQDSVDVLEAAVVQPPNNDRLKVVPIATIPKFSQLAEKVIKTSSMPAVGNLVTNTPGQISENGNIYHTYGTHSLNVPFCIAHNNKVYNIFAGMPDYTSLYLNHSGNTLFELVFSEWLRIIKKGHMMYRFCDDFGIIPEVDPLARIYYPFGNVSVALAVDPLPLWGMTRSINQWFMAPYIAYGSGKAWYEAEVALNVSLNYSGVYQIPFGERNRLARLAELIGQNNTIANTIQVAVLADSYAGLSFISGDSLFGKFTKYSSPAGVPNSFRRTDDVPDSLIFALNSMKDMVLTYKDDSHTVTVSGGDFVSWMDSRKLDFQNLQKSFAYAFGANGAYDTAWSLTIDSLVRNIVSSDIIGNSLEWSVINA